MARFRSKPVETKYVEALYDEGSDSYFVQHVTLGGSAKGKIEQVPAAQFKSQYEPLVRKPRTASGTVTPEAKPHEPAAAKR